MKCSWLCCISSWVSLFAKVLGYGVSQNTKGNTKYKYWYIGNINNKGPRLEKIWLSYAWKTMTQKSLRNRAVWAILLFLLTGKYSRQKVWLEKNTIAVSRLTHITTRKRHKTQTTQLATRFFFNILAILCSWVCWLQPTRRQIFSRRDPYIYLFYWFGSKYCKQHALHERIKITQVNKS